MSKLSPAMKMTLKKMQKFDKPLSSWELHAGLNTLEALSRRGLVRCINSGALGWYFSPQTTLRWELTSSGQWEDAR